MSKASLMAIPATGQHWLAFTIGSLTAIEPTPRISFAANVVTAEDHHGLHRRQAGTVQFDFKKRLGPIGKEVGQGFGKCDKCWMVSRFKGSTQGTSPPVSAT